MNYWLLKTEPNMFSIHDLKAAGVEPWDGIRNYQARNFIRDEMKIGDQVFIYHSRIEPVGIAGRGEIVSEAYPDPSQFDTGSPYFDAKSNPENPRWLMVDIQYRAHFQRVITLRELKSLPQLSEMRVVQKGSRLSVQPVTRQEWQFICRLSETSP